MILVWTRRMPSGLSALLLARTPANAHTHRLQNPLDECGPALRAQGQQAALLLKNRTEHLRFSKRTLETQLR